MIRFILILLQFIFLLIIATWAIRYSQPVSFVFNDVIISTSTSVLLIFLLIVILATLFSQRIIFFFQQYSLKYKFYKERTKNQKGYDAFLQGMIALVNKDFKRAVTETRNVNKYLKDESLSLLLNSETLKVEKKFNELNNIYEKMLKNEHTNLLGLRGLMEHNLRIQDYHHAFIYGEQLFNLNPRIDKLYETLLNIIAKTNNWQKLLRINDQSLKQKIINKTVHSQNKSIALYEIAKIKHNSSESEAIDLMEKAIKLRENFSPYISFYTQLLINNHKLDRARKLLAKTWKAFPHPDLKNEIKLLAKAMQISFYDLTKYITSNSISDDESKILVGESLIEKKDWEGAKNQIKSLLTHQPSKEVCLLMAKIEEGDSGNPQKINAWVSRSNLGKLSKIWVCQISGIPQSQWAPVSNQGYFNSLEWKYRDTMIELSGSGFETNTLTYINT